ncbi:Small G protein signaling modulator 1 [Cichlidogyrus casuarinus]|uniref:Small G protein signaling modulator 1 n=1 Tax=Cichlidogyrus casuarinus TaxID=1844966 RepID=A0ABD2QHV7_9PLAT
MRERLSKLVSTTMVYLDQPELVDSPLSKTKWNAIESDQELLRWIYFAGCEHELRNEIWPVLLGLQSFKASAKEKQSLDQEMRVHYEEVLCEWLPVQTIVEQREKDAHIHRISMLVSASPILFPILQKRQEGNHRCPTSFDSGQATMDEQVTPDAFANNNPFKGINSDIFSDFWINFRTKVTGSSPPPNNQPVSFPSTSYSLLQLSQTTKSEDKENDELTELRPSQGTRSDGEEELDEQEVPLTPKNIVGSAVTSPSQNSFVSAQSSARTNNSTATDEFQTPCSSMTQTYDNSANSTTFEEEDDDTSSQSSLLSGPSVRRKSSRFSRKQLAGVSYPNEILDAFAINLHRIDKDVARCDRNYAFYGTNKHSSSTPGAIDDTGERNLHKLRNVMCTWVWQHMDTGYVQGMCDLLAPLLVVLQEEHLAHACFTRLMCWMLSNFPQASSGSSGIVPRENLTPRPFATDDLSSRPRKLQRLLLDPTLFEHLSQNCEQGQFYFCYRWFLLDFKREFQYKDIFTIWETIWAARLLGLCDYFNLFIALAIIQYYRDLVLCYDMDFTDIIKFFNERAEHHDVEKILTMARNLVYHLQTLLTEE